MKKIAYIFSIILTLASCDVLDKYPLDKPSSSTFPSTEQEMQMALVGCHTPLNFRWTENPYILHFDMYSDIAANRDVRPENSWGDASTGDVRPIWENLYNGISRCNFLIENANRAEDETDPKTYKNILAKARFLRAYYYYTLVHLYGNIPLITKVLPLSEANVSQTPKNEIIDFLLDELEAIAPDLDEANTPNTMGICQAAAWALRSRVALYNERWDVAATSAQEVMKLEDKQVVLDPDYASLTMRAGKTSKEIIWAIQFDYDNITQCTPLAYKSRNAGGYCNRIPVQSLVDSYECIDGKTIDKSSLYNPKRPFENRDPRLGMTIALPGSIYWGYQFETHKDSLECWNYNVTPAKRIANLDATHTYASFSGYAWRKYSDPTEEHSTNSDINIIVLRYGEVLLNYAEAKIEAGQVDQSVLDAINRVRARAYGVDLTSTTEYPAITTTNQAELRSVIRRERKAELAGEGLRYFDIIRWRIAEDVLDGPCYGRIPRGYLSSAPIIDKNGTPDYSDVSNHEEMRVIQIRSFDKSKNYVWPIPDIEIQTNPKLKQNPNY